MGNEERKPGKGQYICFKCGKFYQRPPEFRNGSQEYCKKCVDNFSGGELELYNMIRKHAKFEMDLDFNTLDD
ncbi:MAG: hypothetical protein JW716_04085 [Candidatus Aenigmarchaeota archaeon]|nr:hypothetical protein [Candidatus Aenigmarchaeota archaeon]